MCARYQTPSQAATERYWQVIEPLWHFEPSWRVLPTQQIPIVLSVDGMTTAPTMRWGLISSSGSSRFPLINARAAHVQTGGPWKFARKSWRCCIFVMAAFYEPHAFSAGRKEPFVGRLCGSDRSSAWRAYESTGKTRTGPKRSLAR